MPAAKPPEAPFQPNLYVVARFLDALAQGARSRSELQAAAGVNYDIFRRYLSFLETKGYLRDGDDVRLTPEGARVRAELRAWIDRFLGPGEVAGQPGKHAGAGATAAQPEP